MQQLIYKIDENIKEITLEMESLDLENPEDEYNYNKLFEIRKQMSDALSDLEDYNN